MYMAFLHPEAIILAERQLDESRERTQYIYVMHLSVSNYDRVMPIGTVLSYKSNFFAHFLFFL